MKTDAEFAARVVEPMDMIAGSGVSVGEGREVEVPGEIKLTGGLTMTVGFGEDKESVAAIEGL
jgi:hypothetical protein